MKTFRITLEDDVEAVIYKAKGIADKYGASFEGDTKTGSFNSNGVEGNYKVTQNSENTKNIINIQITKKPIVIPWQLVNATLSSFFGNSVSDGAGAHKVTTKVESSGNISGSVKVSSSSKNKTEAQSETQTTSNKKPESDTSKSDSSKSDSSKSESSGQASTSENNQDGTSGLGGINWRFFQNDKKQTSKTKVKDGVVDAEFTDAKVTDNSPEGRAKAKRRAKAQEVVHSHVLWAAGSGFIPIPLADMAALTALQVGMLEQLANIYDIKTSQATGKGFIKALTGTGVAKLAAQYGASILKTIPVIGTVAGGIAMSVAGGASTYALGQVVIEQFENERDLENIDINEAKAKYNQAYEEGKDITERIKEEEFRQAQEEEFFKADDSTANSAKKESVNAEASTSEASDIFEKIEKLGSLKDKGLISGEEFEAQKAKLLDRL